MNKRDTLGLNCGHTRGTRRKSAAGFTLVEVLVASAILAMATFSVLNLLRLSDAMVFRGKADSRMATLIRSRLSSLVPMTMGGLRTVISSGSYYPTGTTFTFQNGVVPTNSANSTQGFPFVDAASVAAEGAFNTPKYLLWGKPLMGTTTPTYAYPYQETVVLSYPSDYRTARNVQVSYSVTWVDQYSSGNPTNTFTFTFQKYDSLTY